MSEGRTLVHPLAITLGSRPLDVPGRGYMLCASVIFPFRLADGQPVLPADWYQAVSVYGGPMTIPDSLAPLPGAELMVLGTAARLEEDRRKAFLRCGSLSRRFILQRDPEAPDAPLLLDPSSAAWHEADNPIGRGGPEDERTPLILDEDDPEQPVWLGATPIDHPLRSRLVGTVDAASGAGWPRDANPAVLCDTHPRLQAESFHPGDSLAFAGLAGADIETTLPPYRVSITSGWHEARVVAETTRIHCVTLIPEAGLGATIWRTGIALKDDILGEKVILLIAALEDVGDPVREPEYWGSLAVERWTDPVQVLDDRPFLPAALAAAVKLPFGPPPADDPMATRHAAAEKWMREETGFPEENPFTNSAPEEMKAVEEATEAVSDEEDTPDPNAMGDIAKAALAAGKRRHAEAGFPERDAPPEQRPPKPRGERLEAEIALRLSRAYQTPVEIKAAEQVEAHASDTIDAETFLAKLADGRQINPNPPLFWPALPEEEASVFGARLIERLTAENLERHLDVSGAVVDQSGSLAEGGEDLPPVSGRNLDGLLAEETAWRGVRFINCEFSAASFAGGNFEGCEFEDCIFDRVNLSRATLTGCRFARCAFQDMQLVEPVWMTSTFENCTFERMVLTDGATRDLTFTGGSWNGVQWVEGLMVETTLSGTDMEEVTFLNTHAPHTHFERLRMFKVMAMSRGFPGSTFEDIEAETCGFLNGYHFDESKFSRVRFVETGFTAAVFKDVRFSPGCQFTNCDFTGASFENVELSGVRFLQCPMTTSQWLNSKAADAWFMGGMLRGVDFADTELARAVFADADLEETKFQPDRTIGADFRGTVRMLG